MRDFIALLLALALPAIGADSQWERLKTLRPGEKIWIDYMQGDRLRSEKAEMSAWQEDSLAIRLKKTEVVLSRHDVRKVAVYGGKSRARGAGWGALIGTGVGVGILGAALASEPGGLEGSPTAIAGGIAIVFGGTGAAVGAAIGTTKKMVLYEAQRAPGGQAGGR